MADRNAKLVDVYPTDSDKPIIVPYHDNGDGTHSPRVYNDNSTGGGSSTSTSLSDGRKVTAAANTPVALASSSTACKIVTVTALDTNRGVLVVGGSTVNSAPASRTGTPLMPGDTARIDIDNLTKVFISSNVSGDGVSYAYQA